MHNAKTSTRFKAKTGKWGGGNGEGGGGMTSKHTLNNWLSSQSTRQLGNVPMIAEIC